MADRPATPERPTDQQPEGQQTQGQTRPTRGESDWQRRRRLAAVFGDVLPETTSDEREPSELLGEDAGDRWLHAQVPPHHG
jgi:hypothetical protein